MGARKDLSETPFCVVAAIVAVILSMVLTFAYLPPASWLMDLQGRWFGSYSRKLTVLILAMAMFYVAYVTRALIAVIREEGFYERDDEPDRRPRKPRRKRRRLGEVDDED